MKKITSILSLTLLFFAGNLFAQDSTDVKRQYKNKQTEFVDANVDGYNDNARDDDGDGIPNGKDKDFVKGSGKGSGNGPKDGTGRGRNK